MAKGDTSKYDYYGDDSALDVEERYDRATETVIAHINLPFLRNPDSDWSWHDDALCQTRKDVDFFSGLRTEMGEALRVCDQCVVRDECLYFAVDNQIEEGVWGGTTAQQRREARTGKARRKHLDRTYDYRVGVGT